MAAESGPKLFGLPLVHVARARIENGQYHRGVARGWIAIGDVAFGVVLAVGGVAVGGISVGGVGIGFLSIGGLAVGLYALGGLAIGVAAAGGAVFASWAATGGLAVARDFAVGGLAIAKHANDRAAQELFSQNAGLRVVRGALEHTRWLVFLPVFLILIRRMRGTRSDPDSSGPIG